MWVVGDIPVLGTQSDILKILSPTPFKITADTSKDDKHVHHQVENYNADQSYAQSVLGFKTFRGGQRQSEDRGYVDCEVIQDL